MCAVPSPEDMRTRSQIATGSRMQDNLGSELEVRDISGKGEGRMSWAERDGECAPGCFAISVRDRHSKRASSPAAMPLLSTHWAFQQHWHTHRGAKWLLTECSSSCWCPSPPEQTQIIPGHSLSGPFPAPCPPARICTTSVLPLEISEEVFRGYCHCPFYLGLFRMLF